MGLTICDLSAQCAVLPSTLRPLAKPLGVDQAVSSQSVTSHQAESSHLCPANKQTNKHMRNLKNITVLRGLTHNL
jgi:hypothetical protein